ncbi:hypothetical protein F0562_007260 [Nyssa sinensis]|uniref:Uncharacterized protein n=1 Tax=Nyssa sinensis TaxID=561372 RepID=A0A5J5A2W2_9ASTE|nr:hypothetical protein F0562_007260 [Nyssa sinensis]
MEMEGVHSILLWVRFSRLKLNCWVANTIGVIANYIGCPMFIDKLTTTRERLLFSKVCIDVDATRDLPSTAPILEPNGKIHDQPVTYEYVNTRKVGSNGTRKDDRANPTLIDVREISPKSQHLGKFAGKVVVISNAKKTGGHVVPSSHNLVEASNSFGSLGDVEVIPNPPKESVMKSPQQGQNMNISRNNEGKKKSGKKGSNSKNAQISNKQSPNAKY